MIPLPEPNAYSLGMIVKLVSRRLESQGVRKLEEMTAMNGHAHNSIQLCMSKAKYVNPLNPDTPLLSPYVSYSSSGKKLTIFFYKTLPIIYLRTWILHAYALKNYATVEIHFESKEATQKHLPLIKVVSLW